MLYSLSDIVCYYFQPTDCKCAYTVCVCVKNSRCFCCCLKFLTEASHTVLHITTKHSHIQPHSHTCTHTFITKNRATPYNIDMVQWNVVIRVCVCACLSVRSFVNSFFFSVSFFSLVLLLLSLLFVLLASNLYGVHAHLQANIRSLWMRFWSYYFWLSVLLFSHALLMPWLILY